MYFEQQNFFPSMNQSIGDLGKMMGLSMSQQQDHMLETIAHGNDNDSYQDNDYYQDSNNSQDNYSNNNNNDPLGYNLGKEIVIESQQQTYTMNNHPYNQHNQTYAKYQQQIKSLLPEVIYLSYTPQIHSHLIKKHYNRYQSIYQQKISKYQSDLTQKYQNQIQTQIQAIKENINHNLTHKYGHISTLKQQINTLKKTHKSVSLSQQQQSELVQKTINQIFTSEKLLNQIKQKLKPKIQERVKFILLRDMQKQLTKCQNEIQDKIAQERQQFKQKRKVYWQRQAQKELSELAGEYEQLKEKKSTMEEIVKQRLAEKQQIIKKHKEAVEKCQRVKQLQKQIRQIQQQINAKNTKNTKNSNKRSLSKGIQAKQKKSLR